MSRNLSRAQTDVNFPTGLRDKLVEHSVNVKELAAKFKGEDDCCTKLFCSLESPDSGQTRS